MNEHTVTFNKKEYRLDDHGFLDPSDQWDENFAEGMAALLGIYGGLTRDHWEFIRYLRKRFLEEKTVPVIVIACADNRMRLGRLRELFPTGYHRGACKIAGINFSFMCDTNLWLTYETVPASPPEFQVDDLGFLRDFDKWNEQFAHAIAGHWNLTNGLTDQHLRIIQYLRAYYRRTKNIPTVYELCNANDITLDKFGALFPHGYRRGACRAAGLPFLP